MATSGGGGQVGAGRAEWLQKARAYLRDADRCWPGSSLPGQISTRGNG